MSITTPQYCVKTKRTSATRFGLAVFSLVSLAAVFSLVTQRSSPQEERCVTRLKTAARETIFSSTRIHLIDSVKGLDYEPTNWPAPSWLVSR